jgi:4-hydroxybenzoate polyprenyltransferase
LLDTVPRIIKGTADFISNWRSLPPYELMSYILMFASMPLLAYGTVAYTLNRLAVLFFTTITLYCGFFAALIWNDITDVNIDRVVHSDRPLPSGRIERSKFFAIALVFSLFTFIFSSLVNIWCFLSVCFSAFFVAIHNRYLKKKIRFPAYSELVTPLQWTIVPIFGFLAAQVYDIRSILCLVLFTYFADSAHDISEGIHDAKGDEIDGIKTYTTCFGKRKAACFSFAWFIISGILGFLLYFITELSLLYLFLFFIVWLYTFKWYFSLYRMNVRKSETFGLIVGRKGLNYFLVVYDIIFIDMLIQVLAHYFNC